MDSIKLVSMVVELENLLGIVLPDELLLSNSYKSIDDILHAVDTSEASNQ